MSIGAIQVNTGAKLLGTNANQFEFSYSWDGVTDPHINILNGHFDLAGETEHHLAACLESIAWQILGHARNLRERADAA